MNVSSQLTCPPTVSLDMYAFDLVMGFLLPGLFCLFGILGNVISLAVLWSDRSQSPTFLTLKALALSDLVLLTCAFLQQVMPIYIHVSGCMHFACLRIGYLRIYTWPVICIAQMTSVWLTVLISAERHSAICRPLRAYGFSNVRKLKWSILVVLVVSVLFNLPRFFEFTPKEEALFGTNLTYIAIADTTMRTDPVYRYAYNTASFCLIVYAAPIGIITLLNVSIVVRMRRAKRRWSELSRRQQREVKATLMPLCIVTVCFFCGTQSLISFILDAVFVGRDVLWIQIYTAVVNLFVTVNSAANFLIFYVFGSKFRTLLRTMITCWRDGHMLRYHDSPLLRRQFRVRLRSSSINSRNGISRGSHAESYVAPPGVAHRSNTTF
ncbi:hypothetical protein LSH36_292g02008 [Paralvinella palmiformis]|uniref:G-protein coupled receptors family 1 profile domain-containing protein n=1 Tax=Paralvinella palmiformis TaxID=53620 RepID=A0AAD9JI25_9ANNE|nr:hypothetical protein LSH36_292g02008 [Paralvinella palmiformis]